MHTLISTLFGLPQRIPHPISACNALLSPLSLSVLRGVPTVVTTRLTDAGLWAMQHPSVSASQSVLFANTHYTHSLCPALQRMAPCEDGHLARFILFT